MAIDEPDCSNAPSGCAQQLNLQTTPTLTLGTWSCTRTWPCSREPPFCEGPRQQQVLLCRNNSRCGALLGKTGRQSGAQQHAMRARMHRRIEQLGVHPADQTRLLQECHHLRVPHVAGPVPRPASNGRSQCGCLALLVFFLCVFFFFFFVEEQSAARHSTAISLAP